MSTPGEKIPGASELFSRTLGKAVKPGFMLARIPEGGAYQKPVASSPDKCPECGGESVMSTTAEWCLHKKADWVEVTTLGEEHHTFLDPACGGYRREHADRCPRCGDHIPEETETTGAVYWTETEEPYCSMECVIWTHQEWLKEREA